MSAKFVPWKVTINLSVGYLSRVSSSLKGSGDEVLLSGGENICVLVYYFKFLFSICSVTFIWIRNLVLFTFYVNDYGFDH